MLSRISMAAAMLAVAQAAGTTCLATGSAASQPSPSLETCYFYNSDACCVAAHDEMIATAFNSLIPRSCSHLFPELSRLFCSVCAPLQPKTLFNVNTTQEFRICESFASRLFRSPAMYAACGLKITLPNNVPYVVLPGTNEPNGAKDMLNVTAFLNWPGPSGDYPLRPPMLKHAKIIVAPDGTDCFSDASATPQIAVVSLVVAIAATLWISHSN